MPRIEDVFGSSDDEAVEKLKELTQWLDRLPLSILPFVDMGFESLDPGTTQKINQQRQTIEQAFQQVNLPVKDQETVPLWLTYTESFPFWSSPFPDNTIDKFKVGDRVQNLNSSRRDYIPFGARGTVIGKTQQRVIVMFDEQILSGTDMQGLCPLYTGALVYPFHLSNLTA